MSHFESFPDQKYISHVRRELRSTPSRVSVMIGCGFSKFAVPVRPGVGELPLWDELATEMSKELGSSRPHLNARREHVEISEAESAMTVAQEYEDTFGRNELYSFLRRHVRDKYFNPGELHERLLRLPWRDVFTTNWDTLLERTLSSDPDNSFDPVRNEVEISLSNKPRIFKLHGSIDGHYPLIVTKKDYDDYPKYQAPFARTVEQALMETVFCLIGFSGNDPNFVRWSKWVQENLGVVAPRIYLIGWLKLSAQERACLKSRNITAIDLARHPQASTWPEQLRHNFAASWILHSLENLDEFNVADLPMPETQAAAAIPAELQQVEVVASDQPMKEPTPPSIPDDPKKIEKSVHEVLPKWAHNRRLYQGWLMAPIEIRHTLISTISQWQFPVLKVLDRLSPITQLNALRELMWLSEITLEPISPELETAARASVALIDCETQMVNGDLRPDLSWSDVREAWREVALSLLTAARYRLDQESFLERAEMLTPYLDDDPNIGHRIHHEKSLWAAFSLDFETLDRRLQEWNTEECDPIWMMRKAALLSEAGKDKDSREHIDRAMANIRRIPDDGRGVAGPSREGWALWSTIDFENRLEVFERWNQLAALKCDAHAEKADIANSLSTTDTESDPPDFDLGTRYTTPIRYGARGAFLFRKAFRAIRLSEIAGIPVATPEAFPSRANGADLLELAVDRLVKFNSELAARLVLRACTYDKDDALKGVLSRHSIALMPGDAVRRLVADCTRLIDYGLPLGWIEHIRVAVEVLSRLVSRLGPDSALEVFEFSMNLYRDRQHPFASHTWISDPLQNLLNRTWTALSPDEKTRRAIELLAAPIAGLDDFDVQFPDRHPDAGELVNGYPDAPLPTRNAESEAQWQDVIRGLLRALRVEGAPRIRATRRFLPLSENCILTESEVSDVASALWHNEHTLVDGLPGGTQVYDWAFLLLPEPKPGFAATRFLDKWLSGTPVMSRLDLIQSGTTISVSMGAPPNDPTRLEDTLWNLAVAINGLRAYGRSLDLALVHRSRVVCLVSKWANATYLEYRDEFIQTEIRRWTGWALEAMAPIISMVEIPEDISESLFEKLKSLTEQGIPAFGPIGGLVRLIPHRATELATWLRTGLASDDREIAAGAVSGLASWLKLSPDVSSSIQSPPEDVIRELGLIIVARRRAPLAEALSVAKWVFDDGHADLREIVLDSVLQGLVYLADELRYDRELVEEDVPTLRLRCAELASSMAKAGLQDEPPVVRWLEIASEDPFAEVRNAVAENSGG